MLFPRLFNLTYTRVLRPVLFIFDPEKIHNLFVFLGNFLSKFRFTKFLVRKAFFYEDEILNQNILGLDFKNPIGLAAGFDKDARLHNILEDVGFSFMESGSMTWGAYEGNQGKRLKRDKKNKSIWVNYGLKNEGVRVLLDRIRVQKNKNFLLGASVAKTNCKEVKEIDKAIGDYLKSLAFLEKADVVKFYTINISCPNAFGGESFTRPDYLECFLKEFSKLKISKPVFVKMPSHLEWEDFEKLLDVLMKYSISGVVISNLYKKKGAKTGGYSGKPCFKGAQYLVEKTRKKCGENFVIIACGGIFSTDDALAMFKAGADLIELITGMIYEGPQLVGEINKGIAEHMRKNNLKNISEIRS